MNDHPRIVPILIAAWTLVIAEGWLTPSFAGDAEDCVNGAKKIRV